MPSIKKFPVFSMSVTQILPPFLFTISRFFYLHFLNYFSNAHLIGWKKVLSWPHMETYMAGHLGCSLTMQNIPRIFHWKCNKNIIKSCIERNIPLNILPLINSWLMRYFLEYSWNFLHVRLGPKATHDAKNNILSQWVWLFLKLLKTCPHPQDI